MSSVPLRVIVGNDPILLSIDYSLRGSYNQLMFEARETQQLDVDGKLISRVNQLFELSKRAISLGVDLVIEEARDPEIIGYISRQMDRFNGVVDRTKQLLKTSTDKEEITFLTTKLRALEKEVLGYSNIINELDLIEEDCNSRDMRHAEIILIRNGWNYGSIVCKDKFYAGLGADTRGKRSTLNRNSRTQKGDDIQFQRTVKIDVATFPAIVKAAKELGYI